MSTELTFRLYIKLIWLMLLSKVTYTLFQQFEVQRFSQGQAEINPPIIRLSVNSHYHLRTGARFEKNASQPSTNHTMLVH